MELRQDTGRTRNRDRCDGIPDGYAAMSRSGFVHDLELSRILDIRSPGTKGKSLNLRDCHIAAIESHVN